MLSSWLAEEGVWGSNPYLGTLISVIGYLLLPSCDITEISLKQRKILKTAQTQLNKEYCIKSYPTSEWSKSSVLHMYLFFMLSFHVFIILQTIESKLKVTLPDNLPETLRDGVLLCQLANSIRPRAVTSIHVPSPAVVSISDFIDILGHWWIYTCRTAMKWFTY